MFDYNPNALAASLKPCLDARRKSHPQKPRVGHPRSGRSKSRFLSARPGAHKTGGGKSRVAPFGMTIGGRPSGCISDLKVPLAPVALRAVVGNDLGDAMDLCAGLAELEAAQASVI
jgi:hypothetical protein